MQKPLITVSRILYNNDASVSTFTVNGKGVSGFGVEDERRNTKKKGETCIPEGTYELGFHKSPKFSGKYGHDMIHIKNVPGFEYILIHPGNTDDDTEGCYIPGTSIGMLNNQVAVLTSTALYKKLYAAAAPEIKKGGAKIQFINLFPLAAL
ncbi:hypothetical protein EFA69_16255 [Rufibacter immobilis]|uniref:DUF5675 domain-containing protein n=1 Tax=Rufibacter immobilis TaxID=1348778 RepID=A0A3M9MQ83_9BACT|nr:DUF5675 family protein [Rufibacter immobilis]RNI27670.1 hypothetical protein EFA69_16255 [Rufibacter immobilis]